MKFEAVDGCPVPRKLAPAVRAIKARSGATLNSCYRGSDRGARRILRRFGKSTQAALYALFLAGRGNPANRPGFSTHELFNDGVAYAGWAGMPLPYWCVGMDWQDSQRVIEAAAAEGYTATRTYPDNTREYHHLNFRKKPRRKFRALREGDRGRRVRKLHVYLRRLGYLPHTHTVTSYFGPKVAAALREFQRDHGQKADGVYGIQTHRQLKASVRWHKRHG